MKIKDFILVAIFHIFKAPMTTFVLRYNSLWLQTNLCAVYDKVYSLEWTSKDMFKGWDWTMSNHWEDLCDNYLNMKSMFTLASYGFYLSTLDL